MSTVINRVLIFARVQYKVRYLKYFIRIQYGPRLKIFYKEALIPSFWHWVANHWILFRDNLATNCVFEGGNSTWCRSFLLLLPWAFMTQKSLNASQTLPCKVSSTEWQDLFLTPASTLGTCNLTCATLVDLMVSVLRHSTFSVISYTEWWRQRRENSKSHFHFT